MAQPRASMSALNIVADQNMRGVPEYFDGLGSVRMLDGRSLTADDLRDTDVLLVRSVTQVSESLLGGSQVRFVGTATSGFDHVDLDYLNAHNIGFSHAPGANANSVVEYVLSAIASIEDRLERLLAGETIGIVGYGNIGRALARRCAALGISYCVYDPLLARESVSNAASLEQVLNCSVVSIHAALTRQGPWPSHHLLGADRLAALPRETLMINASRGAVVDNDALLDLRRKDAGPLSVLDVWEGEPAIAANLLSAVELGTAHIAGYSLDGKLLATRMLRDAVLQYFAKVASDVEIASDSALPMQTPAGISGAGLIRWALASHYDIRQDDRLLRQATIGAASGSAAAAFDQLRKNYRERRELLGSVVQVERGALQQAKLLTALGCVVQESEHS